MGVAMDHLRSMVSCHRRRGRKAESNDRHQPQPEGSLARPTGSPLHASGRVTLARSTIASWCSDLGPRSPPPSLPHRGRWRHELVAVAHAARLDRRVPRGLATPMLRARVLGCSRTSPRTTGLDLVSSTEFSNGIVGLQYRRHRKTGRGRRFRVAGLLTGPRVARHNLAAMRRRWPAPGRRGCPRSRGRSPTGRQGGPRCRRMRLPARVQRVGRQR